MILKTERKMLLKGRVMLIVQSLIRAPFGTSLRPHCGTRWHCLFMKMPKQMSGLSIFHRKGHHEWQGQLRQVVRPVGGTPKQGFDIH